MIQKEKLYSITKKIKIKSIYLIICGKYGKFKNPKSCGKYEKIKNPKT